MKDMVLQYSVNSDVTNEDIEVCDKCDEEICDKGDDSYYISPSNGSYIRSNPKDSINPKGSINPNFTPIQYIV